MNYNPTTGDLNSGYPTDWPRCHYCGKPCMDGKATCCNAVCQSKEREFRDSMRRLTSVEAEYEARREEP